MSESRWRPILLGVALIVPALAGCDDKVAGPSDHVAPQVAIASPADGTTVSGVAFIVDVDATDDVGIDHVEVSVNGGAPATLASAPYRVHVVTLDVTAGSTMQVQVDAFDAAGNSASSALQVDVATRTLTKLTTDTQADLNPSWSPDGSRIAFQSDRGSGEMNLWVMDADGANPTQLTTNVNEDRNPAWSPDGDWIAFDSDRAGTFDVWRLPVAGTEADAENLTFGNDDDIEPAWSADGAYLYFASSRGVESDYDIWRQNVSSGATLQITSYSDDDRAPSVSPDGRELAFASSLNFTTPHVYTMTLSDLAVVALNSGAGATDADPSWGPVGRSVIFTRSSGPAGNLWFKPVDPDVAPIQVTFGSGTIGDGGAAWDPDGERVAFHSDRDGNADIWLLE